MFNLCFNSNHFIFSKKKTKLRRYLVIVLGLTLVITLCDQISASVIKPYVCRLRPSHTIGVCEFLHYVYGYKGGQYGFVSSHAANTLGAAAFLSYIIKNKRITIYLFTWAFSFAILEYIWGCIIWAM